MIVTESSLSTHGNTDHYPVGHYLHGKIFAKNLRVGDNLILDGNTTLGTPDQPIENLVIGDNVYIGDQCRIWSPDLIIGDYTKIHNHTLVYGRAKIHLGHNVWVGQNSILDGEGGLTLGNNVGVGAYSQLWSHIRHGDVVMGCRYLDFGSLVVGDDAWFVGHCIVSPVQVAPFSVVLVGSTLTKDTEHNHVYGGSPCKDLTEKLGSPFKFPSVVERYEAMLGRLTKFEFENPQHAHKMDIVTNYDFTKNKVQFNVTDRTYTKTGLDFEVAFMKSLLPEAKFTPRVSHVPS